MASEADAQETQQASGAAGKCKPTGSPTPDGMVGQEEAARMLGVGVPGFLKWIRQGRLRYAGVQVGIPGGGRRRVYAIDELRAAHAAMVAEHAARTALPEGFVDQTEAAKMLGLKPKSMESWITNGTVRCGVWAPGRSGQRVKIYPVAELERIRTELAAKRVLPEGMVDIEGACAMFGVSSSAWHIWHNQGKLPAGRWWVDGTRARRRIYEVAELRATMDRLRGASTVWREGGRDGKYHVPEGRVSLREAAAMLGMPEVTVRRWDREGIIESGEMHTAGGRDGGHRVRTFARDEVERLIAEHGRYAPPYPDPDRPGCMRVPLWGRGIERPEAIIDAADLPIVAGRRWYVSRFDDRDALGHVGTSSVSGASLLHHLILGETRTRDECVGHRNGDSLDCRRANLVWRTLSERNAAMPKVKLIRGQPPSSAYKGVSWSEKDGVWRARIKRDGVTRYLGSFHDEIAAAEAYDEAALEAWGEHARLNFPEGIDKYLEQSTPEEATREAA